MARMESPLTHIKGGIFEYCSLIYWDITSRGADGAAQEIKSAYVSPIQVLEGGKGQLESGRLDAAPVGDVPANQLCLCVIGARVGRVLASATGTQIRPTHSASMDDAL